ncbi:MAG: GNAT family N-acetyltransferase [Gammaproteobacteria bacterium]|nr:GNAT family N-acetyltransferase [Gammaproteobacteria bacterium]
MNANPVKFSELSLQQLYDILQLREAVFQLEQNSLYQDLDNHDQGARHLLGYKNKQLAYYARIYQEDNLVHIGRIVVAKEWRGKGMGQELMRECLSFAAQHFKDLSVIISAQSNLQEFYQSFGFVASGEPYDDGGIMHIDMRLGQ